MVLIGAGLVLVGIGAMCAESRFFPVVQDVTISQAQQVGADVIFSVRFNKVRDCEIIQLDWWSGDRSALLGVMEIVIPTGPSVQMRRSTGRQHSPQWRMKNTSLHDLRFHTHADVTHRCHPLWTTTSRFYR